MKNKHICTLGNNIYVYQRLSFKERLKRLFLISENNPRSKTYFRSLASIDRERTRQRTMKRGSLIHPFSMFRMYYEMFFMLVFALFFWKQLHYLVIYLRAKDFHVINSSEFLLEVLYMSDVILTFLTGYVVVRKREIVLDSKQVASVYVRSFGFYLDLYCTIPIDIMLRLILRTDERLNKYYVYLQLLNYTQILRMRKFFIYYDHVSQFIGHFYFLKICLRNYLQAVLILHFLTCLYMNIDYLANKDSDNETSKLECNPVTLLDNLSVYFSAYFFVCANLLGISLVTGYTRPIKLELENDVTTICFLIYAIIGFFACNLVLVHTVQLVHAINLSRTKYYAIKSEVISYMSCKELNPGMRRRILTYYEYKFRSKYFRESTILSMLSETLRRDINLHSCRTLIENVSILKELPPDIISDVVSCLKHEVFLYNDIIFKTGSIGNCMYFIGNGTVAVSTPTGREICHLQDGAYFGEIALISEDRKRVANVIAIEICELYRLDRRNFKACFPQNSIFYRKIVQVAKERLEKTNLLEELHKKYIVDKNFVRNS